MFIYIFFFTESKGKGHYVQQVNKDLKEAKKEFFDYLNKQGKKKPKEFYITVVADPSFLHKTKNNHVTDKSYNLDKYKLDVSSLI